LGSTATAVAGRVRVAFRGETERWRSTWRGFVHRPQFCDAAMSESRGLLHFVTVVNHFRSKRKLYKALGVCLNFNQMSQMQGNSTIRVCSSQVVNRVIHRFRGYPESACRLNQLTIS
jgi:hypothetical protein